MAAQGELVFAVGQVNPEQLDAELRTVLDTAYAALSTGPGTVRVHVTGEVGSLRALVEPVVEAHDPGVLTAAQQARAAQAATMQRLRATPWAGWTAADKEAVMRWVAVRLGALPESEGV